MDETFTVDKAKCVRETEKAVLVEAELFGDDAQWVPKSQIHDDSEVWKMGDDGNLVVNLWLAETKEWT